MWMKEIWGDAADNVIIRGTPYDTGSILRSLIDRGAKTVGDAACPRLSLFPWSSSRKGAGLQYL